MLIYATLRPDGRSEAARTLLAQGGVVSVQVLNEFANVARRKLRRSWPEITRSLASIRALCADPLPITIETHEAALVLAARTGYQLYDALIIASALEADCTMLFTADLHDGQIIEHRLTIRNPFGEPGRR